MSEAPFSAATAPQAWVFDFVLLAAIWGASFLFMRTASHEFGVFATAGLRTCIGALFLLPLLLWRGHAGALRQYGVRTMAIGVLNSAVPFACFSYALLSISTGLSAILNATVPLFGALVAWAWLGDRPSRMRLLGLAIGFAGVTALAWEKASFKPDASGLSTRALVRLAFNQPMNPDSVAAAVSLMPATQIASNGRPIASRRPRIWIGAAGDSGWNGVAIAIPESVASASSAETSPPAPAVASSAANAASTPSNAPIAWCSALASVPSPGHPAARSASRHASIQPCRVAPKQPPDKATRRQGQPTRPADTAPTLVHGRV